MENNENEISKDKFTIDNEIDLVLTNNNHEFWLFGYGSLIWKVDFPFEYSIPGYIKGFLRRFYQHSIDHRGTKEKPGRVCTLIPSNESDAKVWGVAYKIPNDKKSTVLNHLDYREKNGYKRHLVTFFPYVKSRQNSVTLDATDIVKNSEHNEQRQTIDKILVYVATEENESFAGPTEISLIAKQIVNAEGPSGTNREYIYKLGEAMRKLYPDQIDEHLFKLEQLVKEMDNNNNNNNNNNNKREQEKNIVDLSYKTICEVIL